MDPQPPRAIPADEPTRAARASDSCLLCHRPVDLDTDGNGRLLELVPGTRRPHRCPWDRRRETAPELPSRRPPRLAARGPRPLDAPQVGASAGRSGGGARP